MKICIIGTGNQGTGLAGLLVKETGIEEIILADRTVEIAQKAKSKIETLGEDCIVPSIRTVAINAGDTDSIIEAVKEADIIFNGTIPRFNLPIMKACLVLNAHYLDLYSLPVQGDDIPYEETIDAQFELNEAFQAKNLIAIPCVGANPGLSTMIATQLIKELDIVDTVNARTTDFIKTSQFVSTVYPSVFFSHWLGAPGPMFYEDGTLKSINLLDSEEVFEFPAPVGSQIVYSEAGSADLALVPRFADKAIGKMYTKGCVNIDDRPLRDVWLDALSQLLREKQSSENLIEDLASYIPTVNDLPADIDPEKIVTGGAFALMIEVAGQKNGVNLKKTISVVTDYETAVTHLPWSTPGVYSTIGAAPIELILLMVRKQLPSTGVISVAEINGAQLLQQIAKRGHTITKSTQIQY